MFEAARLTDPIAHTNALTGFLIGAVIGIALIATAAFLAFTCGLGAGLLVGLLAGVGASAILGLGEAIGKLFSSRAGSITSGSSDVFINSLPAAHATASTAACDKHSAAPVVAEGSTNVFINGLPAARKNDAITCGAKIDDASPNVFIGGGKQAYLPVADEVPGWLRTSVDWAFALAGLVGGLAGLVKAAGGITRAVLPCAGSYIAGTVVGEAVSRYVVGPVVSRVIGGLVAHPVDVTTGRKLLLPEDEVDFVIQSPLPVICARFYGSNLSFIGALGKGWVLPWEVHLQQRDGKIWLTDAQGRETGFPKVEPGQTAFSDGEQCYLACTHDGRYIQYDLNEQYRDFGNLDIDGSDIAWLRRIEDRSGQWQAYTRDEHGRVITIDTSGGQQLRLHYQNAPSRLIRIECTEGGSRGALVLYEFDELGQLARVVDANGATARQFTYRDGVMKSHTNALGFVSSYEWAQIAGAPRVVSCRTSDGEHTRFRYDPETRQSWADDEMGRTAHWQYDGHHQIVACTDLDGAHYGIEYNDAGMPRTMLLPGEREVVFEYDAASRIVREVDPLGQVTEMAYDGNSLRITHLVTPDGRRWRARYDYLGRLLGTIDPIRRQECFEYGESLSPLPLARLNARGGREQMQWDERGLLLSHSDCSGKTTRYDYDLDGQLVAITNSLGQRIEYQRLRTGEPVQMTLPDGSTEKFEYDAARLLIEHRDGAGLCRRWLRNSRGQVTAMIDPANRHIRYRYDTRARLVELATDEHTRYQFEFDKGDRLAQELRPDGVARILRYDAAGRLQRLEKVGAASAGAGESNCQRRATLFERDKMGRVLACTTDTAISSYHWDRGDRLIAAKRVPTAAGIALGMTASEVQFDYDNAGRLVAEHGAEGTVAYTFDELDNTTSLALPHDQRIDMLMYGSGHVHQIRSGDRIISDIERDDLHREVMRTQGQLTQRVAYDSLGRRTWQSSGGQQEPFGPGLGRFWRSYRYTPAGELAEQRDALRDTIDYQYDRVGQLHKSTRSADQRQERFAWDAAGNLLDDIGRKSKGQVEGNRLKVWQDLRFEYDPWGNLSIKRKGAHRLQQFGFDADDRLITVKTESTHGVTHTCFHYDPLGRRIGVRISHTRLDGHEYVEEKRFVWQGLRMVQEVREHGVSSYVYSPDDLYTPLARMDTVIANVATVAAIKRARQSARLYHFHTDPMGTPLEVTDEAGELAWAGKYSTWGKVDMGEDAAFLPRISQPLRYPGQYADESTGLHYNTFRFYDPDVGRFVSQDPVGLLGGDNLYAYAPNPTGWTDPHGLTKCMMSSADIKAMGPAPANLTKPHLHHIVREMAPKNWPAGARKYITDVQALAKKYGVNINTDKRNFTWAENGSGAHTQKAAEHIWNVLTAADQGGLAQFERALKDLGTDMRAGIFF